MQDLDTLEKLGRVVQATRVRPGPDGPQPSPQHAALFRQEYETHIKDKYAPRRVAATCSPTISS